MNELNFVFNIRCLPNFIFFGKKKDTDSDEVQPETYLLIKHLPV